MQISIQDKSGLIKLIKSLVMFGGFILLLCEIRFAHRSVLIDDWWPLRRFIHDCLLQPHLRDLVP
jgi:hypothetical protein